MSADIYHNSVDEGHYSSSKKCDWVIAPKLFKEDELSEGLFRLKGSITPMLSSSMSSSSIVPLVETLILGRYLPLCLVVFVYLSSLLHSRFPRLCTTDILSLGDAVASRL